MGSLRAVLALLVVYFHTQSPLRHILTVPDGRAAVQMFYLISGFYMCLVLNEKYRTGATDWLFYSNRFLRLWPAIMVVNVLVIASFLAMGEVRLFNLTAGIGDVLRFVAALDPFQIFVLAFTNLFVFGQDLLWFFRFDPSGLAWAPFRTELHNGSALSLNHPLFTVAIEASLYVISPFVLRRGLPVAFGGAVLGGLYHVLIWLAGRQNVIWGYHFAPSAVYFYFLGATAYHLYRRLRAPEIRGRIDAHPALAWIWVVAGLALCWAIYLFLPHPTMFMAPVFAGVVPVLFLSTQQRPVDRMVGELSFGIYLVHYPIIKMIEPLAGPVALWLWASLLAVAGAVAIYYTVERPIDRWRQRRVTARRPEAPPAAVGAGAPPLPSGWRRGPAP